MYESKHFPEMNPFLRKLEKVLEILPNNPKPECKGFYIADFDFAKRTMVVEQIGDVPLEKIARYLHFSTKKATQTFMFKKTFSREFEDTSLEQFPGGFCLNYSVTSVGVSGHDSLIDEAIAVIWTFNRWNFLLNCEYSWKEISETTKKLEKKFPLENKWIGIIADLLLEV